MVDYPSIRGLVGKRVIFSYDTGARIEGVILEVRPAVGTPEMAILRDADVICSNGTVLGHHKQLTVVPNQLKGFEEHPTPAISFRRPNNL